MGKVENVVRVEPEGVEMLEAYSEIANQFKQVGWFSLCEKLQGSNMEVTRAFVERFDDDKVEFGYLTLQVS
jgi:predicted secreted Zn-dependent protease